MDKEELLEFIRGNLSIRCEKKCGAYSNSDYIRISLELNGEEISSDYVDLPAKD